MRNLIALELKRNRLRPYHIATLICGVTMLGFQYLMAAIPHMDPHRSGYGIVLPVLLLDGDHLVGLYGNLCNSFGSHGLPLCGGGIQWETGNSAVELSSQPGKGTVCKAGVGVCLYCWRDAPVRSGDPGCVLSNRITVSALF